MHTENQVLGLTKLGRYIHTYLTESPESQAENYSELETVMRKSHMENPWFTIESQKFALEEWAGLLTGDTLRQWLQGYSVSETPKKVGLILAGNIPLVGFHDVISVILSNHIPLIKLSSKDRHMIPFLLRKWNEFSDTGIRYELVERLEDFDAVIATGSNNTARYLEYYFKNHLSIIRKNRTSVAVLKGDETDEELQLLAEDIFHYFGLGCRNVTRLFIPKDFLIDRLFENFLNFSDIINHHKYANNYDYNRAIYLLNQEKFWDNNFVMLKEDEKLFSPLSVINFSRYESLDEVREFLADHSQDIQCIVAKDELGLDSIPFGQAQHPGLDTYADNVDTMKFLEVV
ncbi:acyl-CoA reductase [Chryseobacterium camelliae]|uniref:acyl-CoA reductase n=1 Tax=Chryseobacterium camelliae TaxID=1265445 RepID=UPI002863D9F0|nr:acyl-CoA reductase [Chryseobacterium camelliae]MDR6513578.1 hypothetical protein [Chryseobacterium camelliae]